MSYLSEVLADSPLLYWRLGESSGTTAADASGNGRTGTYSGAGITYSQTGALVGDANTAVKTVAASSGHIDSTASLDLSAFSIATVEFFLTETAFTNDDKLLCEFASSNWGVQLGTFVIDPNASSTNFQCGVRGTGGGSGRIADFTRPSAAYHYYVFVFNAGADVIKVYVDNVLQSLTLSGAASSGVFGNFTLRVASRAGTSLFLNGTIDEFAVYGGELSVARVGAHYTAAIGDPNRNFAPVIYGRGAC